MNVFTAFKGPNIYTFNLIKMIILSFQTALSHACSSGLTPVVEMLSEIQEVDANIPDKEGNTPIIFAAQAGMYSKNVRFGRLTSRVIVLSIARNLL